MYGISWNFCIRPNCVHYFYLSRTTKAMAAINIYIYKFSFMNWYSSFSYLLYLNAKNMLIQYLMVERDLWTALRGDGRPSFRYCINSDTTLHVLGYPSKVPKNTYYCAWENQYMYLSGKAMEFLYPQKWKR